MPPTRFVPLNVGRREIRLRLLPRFAVRQRAPCRTSGSCGLYAFVNVHAALAFGNRLLRFFWPNVVEPSSRSAPVRKSWLYRSSVAWPKYDSLWICV